MTNEQPSKCKTEYGNELAIINQRQYTVPLHMKKYQAMIDLFGQLSVVSNSNLPGIRFFVYCICIIM